MNAFRKSVLLLLTLLTAVTAAAQTDVSAQEAMTKAANVLNKHTAPQRMKALSATQRKLRLVHTEATEQGGGAPLFYVFNRGEGEGFAIVSGVEETADVLGYGTTGSIDMNRLPAPLKALLSNYAEEIALVRSGADVRLVTDADEENIGEKRLKTIGWSQHEPFNLYTPHNYPTGCVATAMAIVMQYHRWPVNGAHSLDYSQSTQHFITDFDHSNYDWENMPEGDGNNATQEESENVSKLMVDLGTAVGMHYSQNASGAPSTNIAPVLRYHLRYKQSLRYVTKASFGETRWEEMMRAEIDANRPVIYNGWNEYDEGHSFVLDGYVGKKFYFNWGWGGENEAAFLLSTFADEDPTKFSPKFYRMNDAIIGIEPDYETPVFSQVRFAQNYDFCGLTSSVERVTAGSDFSVATGRLHVVEADFAGRLCVAMFAADGTLREMVGTTDFSLKKGNESESIDIACRATADAAEGDYLALIAIENGREDCHDAVLSEEGLARCTVPAYNHRPYATIALETPADPSVEVLGLEEGRALKGRKLSLTVRWDRQRPVADIKTKEEARLIMSNVTEVNGKNQQTVEIPAVALDAYTFVITTYGEDEIMTDFPITSTEAGSLAGKYADGLPKNVEGIAVSGPINLLDFDWFRSQKQLHSFDLYHTEVEAIYDVPERTIPWNVFQMQAQVKSVVLPKRIVHISPNSFNGTSITSITLPSTLKEIEWNAFSGAPITEVVSLAKQPPVLSSTSFSGVSGIVLHVRKGCAEAYRTAEVWKDFQNIVEDAPEVEDEEEDDKKEEEKPDEEEYEGFPPTMVVEEVTGLWCPACPIGIVGMARMNEAYPDDFIGIAVHRRDWMSPAGYAGIDNYTNSYPSAIINRRLSVAADAGEWALKAQYAGIMQQKAPALVEIAELNCNADTSQVSVTVNMQFAKAFAAEKLRLNYVITESEMRAGEGDNPAYFVQYNGLSGSTGDYDGWEDLPYQATDVTFHEVALAITPDFDGYKDFIDADIKPDTTYTHTCTLDIPANFNGQHTTIKRNVNIIVMLSEDGGELLNAARHRLNPGTDTGLDAPHLAPRREAALYNLQGRRVTGRPAKGVYIRNGQKFIVK